MAKQHKHNQKKDKSDKTNKNININKSKGTSFSSSRQKKRHKSKQEIMREKKIESYMAIPLFLVIAFVPVIVFVCKVIMNDPGNLYWDGNNTHYDIFTYFKMVYLLIFAAAGVLLYIFLHKRNPIDTNRCKYYIPAGIYGLLALVSAIFSEYSQVAFFGFLERYEGAFVLMAYMAIMFLAMNVFNEEKTIKKLFVFLLASAAVISIIGLFQYFGMDIFSTGFMYELITPASLKGTGGSLVIKMDKIYSTLYNPNYVGSYMAMIMPVIAVLIFWVKKLAHKIVLAALFALTLINLIGSDSRAGLVGVFIAFAVLIIMYRRKILKHKWIALAVVVVFCGGLVTFNLATDGSLKKRVERMLTLESKEDNDEAVAKLNKVLEGLNDVKLDNEKVEIITDNGRLVITLKDGTLDITDENGKEIASGIENDVIVMTDERFMNVRLNVEPEKGHLYLYYNDYMLMDIMITHNGMLSPSNRWMAYRKGRDIEAFGFEGMEAFGSNRGYIWSRSLPLLKDTVFIGNGPDTFAIYFPQYDFLNKLKYYQTGNIFVDKAHNMYLQTALNTGVLSLLAILALFGMYVVSSIKVYWKEDFTGFLPVAGAACFTAFCGYAAAGLFNDSAISVAPVFWVLLGLGIGINLLLVKRNETKAQETKQSEAV